MNRTRLCFALIGFAFLVAGQAHAAAQFSGTWRGDAEHWTVRLVVFGAEGTLSLTCGSSKYDFDVPVSANGTIDAWIPARGFSPQTVRGRLPLIVIPSTAECKGGRADLRR